MKFILELWPDVDDSAPEELLGFALDAIRNNPDLRWTITTDDGTVLHDDVSRS